VETVSIFCVWTVVLSGAFTLLGLVVVVIASAVHLYRSLLKVKQVEYQPAVVAPEPIPEVKTEVINRPVCSCGKFLPTDPTRVDIINGVAVKVFRCSCGKSVSV